MKLLYMGTAAAEGIPAMFCHCPLCVRARVLGGKNIRSRSQTLINDDLLIDFGPDSFWHACRYGLDFGNIKYLLITHAHEDHYMPSELDYRHEPFAHMRKEGEDAPPPLEICISKGSFAYEGARYSENAYLANDPDAYIFRFAEAFIPMCLGRYTVTPLTANHAPGFEALIYLISDGEKTVLYAHDSGLLPEETLDYLKQTKPHVDFASLDCTGMASGHNTGGGKHMNLERNTVTRDQLTALGCADGKTVFCCNHFSHNGKSTHEELEQIMAKHGFMVSYDGMEVLI